MGTEKWRRYIEAVCIQIASLLRIKKRFEEKNTSPSLGRESRYNTGIAGNEIQEAFRWPTRKKY